MMEPYNTLCSQKYMELENYFSSIPYSVAIQMLESICIKSSRYVVVAEASVVVFRTCFVRQIQLSKTMMNCIELVEENGCVWSLTPVAVDEADDLHVCESWLTPLFCYLNPASRARSTQIVFSGFVFKRGAVNRSLKRRWMVLTSDGKVILFAFL
jgi:hypothetical protein